MASLLRVEGDWPEPLTATLGWFRARARPWNEEMTGPMLRLDRGGAEFLISVTNHLEELTGQLCFSPALYGGATRVWRRAGYEPHVELGIMERGLGQPALDSGLHDVRALPDPDWEAVLAVDRQAFEGFWAMSRDALIEAHATNRSSTLFTVSRGPELAGFAIVGSQWGVGYLHRIAVGPRFRGEGVARSLLAASINWASKTGARSMVLNVRPENTGARRLYEKSGFSDSGASLQVLRHRPG